MFPAVVPTLTLPVKTEIPVKIPDPDVVAFKVEMKFVDVIPLNRGNRS
jgi:hypothetical protein